MSHELVQKFYLIIELVHRLKISQDFLKQVLGNFDPPLETPLVSALSSTNNTTSTELLI